MNTSNGKQHISRHPNGLQVFRRKLLPASMMSLLGLFAYGNDAWAGGHVSVNTTPTGGSIVGGNGTILQNGALTTIQQNSQLLSINWQSFNVGANASVLFKQPSFTSVALNRILDQNASQIFGHINSNGQVFLINTHGIIFGRTSQLNVGGLMASTLDLTPTDFLSNHFNLDAHGGSAGIVNHGTIDAASGSVSLVGGQVVNDGLIIANYGHINLDGADRAVLDFDGDGLIDIQITGALQKRLNADEAAVTNKGKLQADGGTVVLQASAAKDLFTNLVNNTGVVSAGGISTHGGKVQLIASGGNAVTSGTIDVSGAQGGSVQVLSDQNVSVTGNINASGTNGGGSIRVGGGFHGGEGLTTANTAYVGPSATLNADATQTGNGGSVVVWGNQGNDFEGSITARGGALGGNGGQVETSAHNGLNADGDVNASAAHGTTGSWLLDPYNVTIGGSNSGYSTINGSGTVEYSANANSSNIKASTIGAALNNGTDVFVYTNNAGGSQNGDITVSRGITANGQGSLYLQASGSIFVNNNISGDNFGDALNVYLWANYSGTGGATAYSRGTCASSTGCVVQIGNGAGITTNGGNLDIETNGGVSLAAGSGGGSSISTGGGNVTIGTSSNPVNSLSVTGGSSIATFGGNIDVETGGQASVDSTSYIDTTNTVGALGNLAINAGAGINAAGALTISGTTTLNGGAGAISAYDSGNGNNNLVGTVSITNEGNNAVIVSNDSGVLNLGKVSVGTSTLSLSGVGIAQSSGTTISQASGTNPVTSEAVTLIGGSAAITLNNANDFVGGITASNSGASNGITLNNGSNAMTLAGVTAGGGLLATSTGGIDLAGTITTGTGQNYQGAVTLTADSSLASNTGGAIVFNSTVDGAQNLSITNGGTTTFNGTVGSTVALQSLNVLGGGKTVLDANVTTAGTQSYGTLALGNSVILASTSAGVTFNGTVDNATSTTQEALTINAAGPVAFDGAVGAIGNGALSSLTVTSTGASAGITQGGLLYVSGASTFNAGTNGAITLGESTNQLQGQVSLTGGTVTLANSDATILGSGTVTGALTLTSAGTGGISQATGTTLTATGGGSITASNGAIALGNQNDLGGTFNLSGGTTQVVDTSGLTLGTVTTGNLTVSSGGALDLGKGTVTGTLTATGNGAISQASGNGSGLTVTQAASFTQNANGADVLLGNTNNQFNSSVTFSPAAGVEIGSLSLAATSAPGGTVTLPGAVSGNLTLNYGSSALTVPNSIVVGGNLSMTGSDITLNGNESTGGSQTYNGHLLLGAATVLTATAGGVTFNGTVDNATSTTQEALTINAAGPVAFDGAVGAIGNGALSSLTVTSTGASAGITQGGLLYVSGASTFNAGTSGAITLGESTNQLQGPVSLTGGTVTLANSDATILGSGTVTGALTLTSAGAGGISQATGTTLTATGGGSITASNGAIALGNQNDLGGTFNLTGGTTQVVDTSGLTLGTVTTGNLTVSSGGALDLGKGTVTGTLTATGNGAISQASGSGSGLTVTQAASFTQNANGADVLLGNANNLFSGAVSFIEGPSVQIGSLSLANTYASTTAQTVSLPSSLSGSLTLDYSAAPLAISASSVGGTLSVTGTSITLNGNESSGGLQTYTGHLLLGTSATLTSTAGGVTFNGTVDNATSTTQEALTINAAGPVAFDGAVGAIGNGALSSLTVTSTGASAGITQGGLFYVSGASTFNAGTNGAITLGESTNQLQGQVSLTGGTVTLANSDATILGSGTVTGALTLTSAGTGGISQATGTTLTATGGGSITASNGAIALGNQNDLGGTFNLSGGTTQVVDTSGLTLGTVTTGNLTVSSGGALDLGEGTVTGTLTAAGNGAISQASGNGSGLTVTQAASFTQNANGADVLLGNANNLFSGAVSFNEAPSVQIGNLSLTNTYASTTAQTVSLPSSLSGSLTLDYSAAPLAISASSVGGTLSVTGTSIALNGNESSVGSQTYDGAVEFGAGATALSATGAGSNITFDDTVGSLQALSLSAKGAVTFDGLATLAGLTSTSGTFNAGGLNIGTGGLSVTTTSGAISQSQNGAFVVAGTSSFNAGGQAITLTDSGNQFTGVVTLTGGTTQISQGAATPLILGNLQTGALTATSQNALILGSGVIGGNLVATGGGQISQTGALSVSGTSTINAGNAAIALSNAGNVFSGTVSLTGGATQIADNAPLSFGSVNVGALIATSNGAITEGSGSNAGMIVNGTASFTQNDTSHGTGEDILLGNANNKFSGNETFAAGSGAGAQINNLTFVNGSTTPGAVILPTTVAGNLTLDYSAAPIAVTGTNVGGALAITGKGITLDGSETSVGAQTYDGAVTLGTNTTLQSTGNGAIELTQSVSGPHALVISTGGTASIGGATSLTGLSSTSSTFSANALNIGAGGLSVTTTGGSITQSGAFVVTGASAFNAGSNAITLTDPGNNFAGAVALTGGTTQISQGSALTLGALHTGALTVTSQGNLVLGSGAIGGDLAATSNGGAISQTGALSVSGNSSVNAGNAAINLANGGNVFGGSVSLVGGATQIADASALNLGSLNTGDLTASSNGSLNLGSGNVSGNLVATSNGGAIGQTDALSVAGTATLNAGNGAISLTNNGNAFTGTVTATGAGVSLNDAGDLTVASLTDNGNGAVSLNATGMLTTYGINAGSGDISLASNGSTLTTGGALSGGNVSLTGLNGITSQNSIAASGTLTMSSAQGGISSSGSISAGTLTGSSAGAVALNANNAIGALGTFSASGFSLTNGQSLTVAGPLTGGASTALTVTSGDLALDSAVSGTNTALSASGVITEGGNGSITASILGGSAGGAVTLNGTNQIGTLGNFSAASFNLVDGQALAVSGAVNGGSAASITSTGGGLTINGSVAGTTTTLNAAGAISENGGSIVAGSLSGSANGAATLNGHNQVGTLQGFAANGFNFTDGQSLTVNGTVNGNSTTTLTTTAGNININGALDGSTVALYSAGAIGEGGDGINANTLTGSSAGATNLTGINQIDTLGSFTANGFSLVNARTLAINGPVNGGSSLALTTSNGDMAINGTVSGSATSLNSAGTLSEGSAGSIAAGSLSGSAGGGTTLTGQNKVGTLGDFRSLLGFSFADAQSLTLSALNGSNYTVNAGTSPVSLAVTGDLFQTDHNWLYDGTGTWSATGSIGTATNPIYVLGLTTQYIGLLGDPPAYFYAVGPLGNILPIIGDGVNVPTSLVSSRAQNVNNHLDAYIDASVITANYRSFGIVAPGILLPTDQQKCEAQGNSDCSDE